MPKKFCKWSKCGKEFEPVRFNQKTCNNYMCALGFSREHLGKKEVKKKLKLKVDETPKAIEKRYQACKKTVKAEKIYSKLQQSINRLVRILDYGHDCISSGLPFGSYFVNAGHYFGVGPHGSVRYHLMNIFNQSKKDNKEYGGRGSTYGKRLAEVFGQEIRDEIEGLVARHPYLGLGPQEATEAMKTVNKIIREMPENKIYTTEQRIELRRELNERIGIYRQAVKLSA